MDRLSQDLRFALRTLSKSPTFTVVAVATLALGIGTNAAMFSLVDGVVFRDLPYGDPERIVTIWGNTVDGNLAVSELERERYVAQTELFEDFGAHERFWANLTGEGEAVRAPGAAMNAGVLSVLGVAPILGRNFDPAEDRRGADGVVILGYELWQSRFGGRGDVLGETLFVNGRARRIVGVLPAELRLPGDFVGEGSQLYVPLALGDPDPRNIHYLRGVARLRDGVTLPEARERLVALSATLRTEIPTLPPTFVATAVPVREEVVGDVRPALLTLLAAVGLVLLIACVNVANLFLARADGRRRELWIRAAMGASRQRLRSQLLAESFVLASLGGVVGIALASFITRVAVRIGPPNLPRIETVQVDVSVLLYTLAITLAAALLFGVAPAFRAAARTSPADVGARVTGARARHRMRTALVVAEVALALMLASGAGLLTRSFLELRSVGPGFDAATVLTMDVTLSSTYAEQTPARRFHQDLLERVRGLAGVVSAGAVSHLPLASDTSDWGVRIEGREEERLPSGRRPWAEYIVVTDGYFEALGRPLIEGRFTEAADVSSAEPTVVINETMAARYWPNESPVGRRFKLSSNIDTVYRRIVGVVADARHDGLGAEVRPEMYLPYWQFPATADFVIGTMNLVVRASGDPLALAGVIRAEVQSLDADVPVSRVRTMDEVVRASTSAEWVNAVLFTFFGTLGLLLVSVGVYGVMAVLVSERRREMGIRMALGARPASVSRSILGRGLVLSLAGMALGLAGAVVVGRLLRGLLFGVSWYDPTTLVVVPLVVLAATMAACYVPARRATRVDPAAVLRAE